MKEQSEMGVFSTSLKVPASCSLVSERSVGTAGEPRAVGRAGASTDSEGARGRAGSGRFSRQRRRAPLTEMPALKCPEGTH